MSKRKTRSSSKVKQLTKSKSKHVTKSFFYRSASSGQYVTQRYAFQHPQTTFRESYAVKKQENEIIKWKISSSKVQPPVHNKKKDVKAKKNQDNDTDDTGPMKKGKYEIE
jgi:hypothetical protein